MAQALADLNARSGDLGGIDLILLGRGGGSLEDLWEFNEEILARAIAASRIPVVTGIGHEIDVSIADLVADYHAHTPTEAAQVAMAQWRTARELVEAGQLRLRREIALRLQDARQRLTQIQRHEVFRRPLDRLNAARQRLDDWQRTLSLAMLSRMQVCRQRVSRLLAALSERHPRHRLELNRQRLQSLSNQLRRCVGSAQQGRRALLQALAARLNAVGPQQVLKRGYSITTLKKTGAIVRSVKDVRPGHRLLTRLADGTLESTAEDSAQMKLFD
jgi:exodeoxyribonuclease VII large subunit